MRYFLRGISFYLFVSTYLFLVHFWGRACYQSLRHSFSFVSLTVEMYYHHDTLLQVHPHYYDIRIPGY